MATETLEDKQPEEEALPVSHKEIKDDPEVELQKSQGEDGKQEQNDEMEVERPKEQEISNELEGSSGEIAKSENISVPEQAPEAAQVMEEGGEKREEQNEEMKEESAKEGDMEEKHKKVEEAMEEENAGKIEQLDDGKEKNEEQENVEKKMEEDEEVEESKKPKAKVGRKRASVSAEDPRVSKRGQESEDKIKSGNTAAEEKKENDGHSKDPVTPTSDRPTRERKRVERFSVPSPAGKSGKSSAGKALSIEKGRGTQLKDIPNVAFKLSKRKPDGNLQTLHSILFGKKAKAHLLKRDIGQFSGYVWAENEEKQRAKVKDKLDKCVKEKLLDFCDVLNIPINKSSARKEELSVQILEFLESPHLTTEVLLADKEQKGQKRRRNVTPNKSVGEGSTGKLPKKQKQMPQLGRKQKLSSEMEDGDDIQVEPCDAKDDSADGESVSLPNEESDDGKSKSDEEDDKPKANSSIKKSSSKVEKESVFSKTSDKKASTTKKGTPAKASKSSEKYSNNTTSKKGAVDPGSNSGSLSKSKASTSKRQNVEIEQDKYIKESTTSKKQANKPTSKVSTKDQGKNKSSKKKKNEPSREEMHAVVVDILKEVDFNTATLSDILRQLGTHFDQDLMHRKAEVKDIITDVINSMSDEDEEEEEDNGEDRE